MVRGLVDTAQLRPGHRLPISWADHEARGEVRGEYIDGHLIVSPVPTRIHQRISRSLLMCIQGALPTTAEALPDRGWRPADDEFVPDLMVVDRNDEIRFFSEVPHLVVEILSSEPARDLIRNVGKYSDAGLERYWVVDPDGPEIIVFERVGGHLAERSRHRKPVSLDIGPATVEIDPSPPAD